jgi:hypothetical protein
MQLLDLVKQAGNLYDSGTALHLIGPPGIGKSDVVKNEFKAAIEAHLGHPIGYCCLIVPTIEAPDLRGFLIPTKDAQGRPTSFFTRPAVMPSEDYLKEFPCGIMMLDECNQADQLTQKALAPVKLEKRFGEYVLPKGYLVVSASNRQEDGSGVGKALKHLVNRERTLEIQPSILSWALWAEARNVHPMLIAFAKAFPGVVFSDKVPKEDGPYCTPRSFMSAAKLIGMVAGVDSNGDPNMKIPNDGLMMQLVAGDIGGKRAAELFAYLKVADDLPTIEEILANPQTCKCPKELSAAYAAVQMCVHFAKPDNIDKLWTFAERMPKELQVSTCRSLVDRGGGALLNSTALNKWIMANKTLINASSAK